VEGVDGPAAAVPKPNEVASGEETRVLEPWTAPKLSGWMGMVVVGVDGCSRSSEGDSS
jgi:hypothetical protein